MLECRLYALRIYTHYGIYVEVHGAWAPRSGVLVFFPRVRNVYYTVVLVVLKIYSCSLLHHLQSLHKYSITSS